MSPLEKPATMTAHIRYHNNGRSVDPPTSAPQKVGKLLAFSGRTRSWASYKVQCQRVLCLEPQLNGHALGRDNACDIIQRGLDTKHTCCNFCLGE